MRRLVSLIFGGTFLWIMIVLNQYSSENFRANTPERSFFQLHCNNSEPIYKEHRVTVTTTKIVVVTECPEAEQRCDEKECRARGGNCRDNICNWDSGWGLDLEDFKPPEIAEKKYSWETKGKTPSKLLRYPEYQIPPILHQSWKTSTVPARYSDWKESCMKIQPTWDHLLWSDEDNRQFITKEYPWLLYAYDRLRGSILRADFVRYAYLHFYGGVYADLDVECIKPIDPLLKNKNIILGVLGDDYDFIHNIPNAILASRRGHPFWLFLLNRITMMMHQNDKVEATTGPIILRDAYLLFKKYEKYAGDFFVAPPGILYGVVFYYLFRIGIMRLNLVLPLLVESWILNNVKRTFPMLIWSRIGHTHGNKTF